MQFLKLSLISGAIIGFSASLAVAQTLENPTTAEDLFPAIRQAIPTGVAQTPGTSAQPTVRNRIVRFVNSRGEAVDREGNPIEGRLPQEFITNELRLQAGDIYDPDIVQADLQQLYQLGLWGNVTVSVVEVPDENQVDVIYNVNERAARSFNFGGGINDDVGIYGEVGYRSATIGRLHQRLEVNTQVSLRDVGGRIQFVSPYRYGEDGLGFSFGGFRDRSISNIFDQDVDLPNGDRVRIGRVGGNVNFTRPIGRWYSTVGLNYNRISTRDANWNIARRDERGNPLTWSGTGIDDLYTVSFATRRDWRDNPFDPRSGGILTLATQQSIPIGVGNILQNRLTADYLLYVPTRWVSSEAQNLQPNTLPEMFAFNLQAGTILGDLPPHQAFALGGFNSVRGYGSGDVGSGRSYFLASGEYRFPLFSRVGGVVFADFATDLGSGDTVLGEPANARDKPGTGMGGGIGLRWRSPLGLVRFDLGISDRGRIYFELGTGQRY